MDRAVARSGVLVVSEPSTPSSLECVETERRNARLNTARAFLANIGSCGFHDEAQRMRDIAQGQVCKLTPTLDAELNQLFTELRGELLAGRLDQATELTLHAGRLCAGVPALLALLACLWRRQGQTERALSLMARAMGNERLNGAWRVVLGWERWLAMSQKRLHALLAADDLDRAGLLARKMLRRDQDCGAALAVLADGGNLQGLLRQVDMLTPSMLPRPMSVVQADDGALYFGSYTMEGTQAALSRLGPGEREPRTLGTGRQFSGLVLDPRKTGLVGLCGGEGGDLRVRALHRLDFSGRTLETRDIARVDGLGQGLPYGLGCTGSGTLVFLDLARSRLYAASAVDLLPRMICDVGRHGRPLFYGVIGEKVYVTFADVGQLLIVDVGTGATSIVRREDLRGVLSICQLPGCTGFFMVKRLYVKPGNVGLLYDMLIGTDADFTVVSTTSLGCGLSCGVMPFRRGGESCLLSLNYYKDSVVYRLSA